CSPCRCTSPRGTFTSTPCTRPSQPANCCMRNRPAPAAAARTGLGLLHIGALRLAGQGYIPADWASHADKKLSSSRAEHGGREPLDWVLARSWDTYLGELE